MAEDHVPGFRTAAKSRLNDGQTPKRYFRMDEGDRAKVERAAQASGQITSEFIRETLLRTAMRRS